jgi:hypothetical protein
MLGFMAPADSRRSPGGYALGIAIAIGVGAGALGQLLVILGDYPPVTAQYGGSGGNPVVASCEPGEHVTGAHVYVSTTQVVAGISPRCSAAASGEAGVYRGVVGTRQGTPTKLRCPAGWRAVGIWGASGTVVDKVSLSCAPRPGGPVVYLEGAGGNGGAGFHASCPRGELRGLTGRAGMLLDNIGMLCDDSAI